MSNLNFIARRGENDKAIKSLLKRSHRLALVPVTLTFVIMTLLICKNDPDNYLFMAVTTIWVLSLREAFFLLKEKFFGFFLKKNNIY